jgi:hypothetical protein
MLFKEIIYLCSENQMRPTGTLSGRDVDFVNVKASGTYIYHSTLKR